jgi:predicted transcriptional regulator
MEADLDSILITIENPVRRRIIKSLSEEPSYQLRLSKELGFSQQLVAKHLDTMEDAGMVSSLLEESPRGPRRKEYLLRKSVSLSIDFAPNLFRARVLTFNTAPEGGEAGDEISALTSKVTEVMNSAGDRQKLGPMADLVAEIDKRLLNIEDERTLLLYFRNMSMNQAAKLIAGLDKAVERKRALHRMIERHERGIQGIAKSLDLSEELTRQVIAYLERDLNLP